MTYTLLASRFLPVDKQMLVSAPLQGSPQTRMSVFLNLTGADIIFIIEPGVGIIARTRQGNYGAPGYTPPGPGVPDDDPASINDPKIKGGQGYLIVNKKSPTTGTNIVFDGPGWCNVFSNNAVTPCP